jgi:predicted nucleotidyltransferase
MATILLPPDFKEFLQLLNENGVEYLLIGGYAVGYYGYPRATGDMDIWVAMNPKNAERIVGALTAFGFGPETGVSSEMFLNPDQIVRMGNPPLRLELLTTISGVEFADCYARRNTVVLDDVPVDFISLADLRQNKAASGRSKDVNDLQNLP